MLTKTKKWFSNNEKWLIPFSSVCMMFIAVISICFTVRQGNKNYNSQLEMYRFQRQESIRIFKSDSQNLILALKQYNLNNRPYISIDKINLTTINGKIKVLISCKNKSNVPVVIVGVYIDYSFLNSHETVSKNFNVVIAPNEPFDPALTLKPKMIEDKHNMSIKLRYHSIFSEEDDYFSEWKFVFVPKLNKIYFGEMNTN